MVEKILGRFIYEDLEYMVGTNVEFIHSYKVDYPFVMISTKSSKKKRGKSNHKFDAHYLRVDVKEPIKLARKILNVYKEAYINTDFIIVQGYDDSKWKRERLYITALQTIGFIFIKEYNKSNILIRKDLKVKKKHINNILKKLE